MTETQHNAPQTARTPPGLAPNTFDRIPEVSATPHRRWFGGAIGALVLGLTACGGPKADEATPALASATAEESTNKATAANEPAHAAAAATDGPKDDQDGAPTKDHPAKAANEVTADPAPPPAAAPPAPPATGSDAAQALYREARTLHNSDPQRAITLYQQAADGGHHAAYKQIGSLKLKLDDKAGAIVAYETFLKLSPNTGDAPMVRELVDRLRR